MRLQRPYRSVATVLAGVALLGVLAACSNSATPSGASSATPTTSAAPGCADVTELKTSLEDLTKVNPLQDGVESLNTAIDNVKSSLDAAVASASATLQPEVDDVKSAFATLETAVTGLTADNLVQKAPDVTAALLQVTTATSALGSSVAQNCPAS
jgi:hypothetical protein